MNSARRRVVVALSCAAAVLLVFAVGWIASRHVSSPAQRAAQAKPPLARPVTTELDVRKLGQVLTQNVTAVPGGDYQLKTPEGLVSPDSIVTSVDVQPGDIIDDGSLLLDVSGQPLIAASLPFPLWRDLSTGDAGPDVVAVSAFLRRQGFLSKTYTTSTPVDDALSSAATRMLRHYGYPPPAQSSDAPTGTATASPSGAQNAPPTTQVLKRSWFLRIDGPHTVSNVGTSIGASLASADAVLFACDVTAPTFQARFDRSGAALLHQGDVGTISNPADGTTAQATLLTVDDTPTTDQTSGVSGLLATFVAANASSVTATPGDLTVTIDTSASAKPTLAAPVTAIFTEVDGGSHLVEVTNGSVGADIAVTVGDCVDGWCAVSGSDPALKAGQPVLVGSQR